MYKHSSRAGYTYKDLIKLNYMKDKSYNMFAPFSKIIMSKFKNVI